jgi:transmembrane sensor
MAINRIWELWVKKFNNKISSAEQDELESLLRQHQDVFEVNELLTGLKDLPLKPLTNIQDEEKSRTNISSTIGITENHSSDVIEPEPQPGRVLKYRKHIRAAAASLLIIGACWLYFKDRAGSSSTISANEFITSAGSKSTVNLPDGSVVVLNASSRLSYKKDFGISNREITLTGEAYFDVVKNQGLPMVVHTSAIDIWVKGTAFNVKSYPEDAAVETALIRGTIEVVPHNDPERKILLRPHEKITIGKKALIGAAIQNRPAADKEDTFSITQIKPGSLHNSYPELAWLNNNLVFQKEKFEILARRMERWYNVEIEFLNEDVKQLSFSGSLEKESLAEALEALRLSHPFNYVIEQRKVLIRK